MTNETATELYLITTMKPIAVLHDGRDGYGDTLVMQDMAEDEKGVLYGAVCSVRQMEVDSCVKWGGDDLPKVAIFPNNIAATQKLAKSGA